MFHLRNYIAMLTLLFLICLTVISRGESEYSKDEIFALEKFRPLVDDAIIHDYHKADSYLIRWLRAQNLNLNAANHMLRKAMKWRKQNQIDNILNLNETLSLAIVAIPFLISTEEIDYDGNPVMTWSIAKLDIRKYLLEGKKKILEMYFIKSYELMELRIRELATRTKRNITQFVRLADVQGYNLRQHNCIPCFEFWLNIALTAEAYYPGLRKLDIYINIPRIFKMLVERVLPFYSAETRKITVLKDTNKAEWSEYLLKHIPIEQRTFQFGGTKKS